MLETRNPALSLVVPAFVAVFAACAVERQGDEAPGDPAQSVDCLFELATAAGVQVRCDAADGTALVEPTVAVGAFEQIEMLVAHGYTLRDVYLVGRAASDDPVASVASVGHSAHAIEPSRFRKLLPLGDQALRAGIKLVVDGSDEHVDYMVDMIKGPLRGAIGLLQARHKQVLRAEELGMGLTDRSRGARHYANRIKGVRVEGGKIDVALSTKLGELQLLTQVPHDLPGRDAADQILRAAGSHLEVHNGAPVHVLPLGSARGARLLTNDVVWNVFRGELAPKKGPQISAEVFAQHLLSALAKHTNFQPAQPTPAPPTPPAGGPRLLARLRAFVQALNHVVGAL